MVEVKKICPMKKFYEYSIEFYDKFDEESSIDYGITVAKDYTEAINNILESFRFSCSDELDVEVGKISIEEWSEGNETTYSFGKFAESNMFDLDSLKKVNLRN